MPSGEANNNGCRLYELEQFICDYSENEDIKVKCYPLPRIFYEQVFQNDFVNEISIFKTFFFRCPNRPVVEITSLVTIDEKTGELTIPDNLE